MVDLLVITAILFVAIFLLAVAVGSNLFAIMTAEQRRYLRLIEMYAAAPAAIPARDLPEPVYRFVSKASNEGDSRTPACTRIRFQGRIRFGKNGRWLHTGGRATFAFAVPAYTWQATTTYAPGIWLETFDYCVSSNTGMLLDLFSFVPLNNARGPEISRSALFRYLAGIPFFPQRAGCAGALVWDHIDETAARAVVRDGGMSAAGLVRFDAKGQVESITADYPADYPVDPAVPNRRIGLLSCRFSGSFEAGGNRVPREMVLEQVLPDGASACAELTIVQVEYDLRGTGGKAGTA